LAAVAHLFLFIVFSKLVILNIYVPIVFTYLVIKHYRHRRWMPMTVFCGVLGHLALVHLHRQFFETDLNDNPVDQSSPLMMLAIKLTTFAFDISDAYFAATAPKPKKGIRRKTSAKGNETPPEANIEDPKKEAQLISLQRFPNFLEFAGYAFLFPGFLTGPVISFYEYRCFIDGSYFEGVDATKGALAGRKRRALKQFLTSMVFMLIYAGLKDVVNLKQSLTPDHLAKPIWYRLIYLHVAILVWRSKYYFAWLVAEGSYVMIGLGFRKHAAGSHSHKARWDRCENVNVKRVELAYNFKQVVSEWNVATNQWLYAYVYKRIADWQYPGRRPGFRANLATYVVSAFWHVPVMHVLHYLISIGILSRILHPICLRRHVHLPVTMYKQFNACFY
jgi:lysophospholipid acyltransferase